MTYELAPYPDFDDSALCRQTDPEVFFPDKGGSTREAKATCSACAFQRPCLAYALTHEVDGVWGGTSVKERRRLRREYGIQVRPYMPPSYYAETPIQNAEPEEQW